MSSRPLAWIAALSFAFLGSLARADVVILDELYFKGMQPENRRPPEFLRAIACAPDGKTLVSAGKTGFDFWNLDTGIRLENLPGENLYGTGVAFSPDGKSLFTADLAGNLLRWDVEKRRVAFRFPKVHATIERMTLSADGSTLATTDGTCAVCWDARTGRFLEGWNIATTTPNHRSRMMYRLREPALPDHEKMPHRHHLVLSADGRWCASHVDNAVMQVRAATKSDPIRHKWAEDTIAGLDISPDGKRFAVASRSGAVQIVESITLHPLRGMKNAAPDCLVCFSPDGAALIAHHPEIGILMAFDSQTGNALWHHRQAPAWRSTALTFLADGRQLVTGDSDRKIRVYDLATGKIARTLAFPPEPKVKEALKKAPPAPPMHLTLPEHARLRLGAPHLWYPSSLTAGFFLKGGTELLVFPQWDGETAPMVYDTQSGRLVRRLDALKEAQVGYQQVILLPDRRHLLLVADGWLNWWDLEKNRVVRTYQFASSISAVAVSKDGKRFAVAGSAEPLFPQPIHVWDMDGQHVQTMQGHKVPINKLAFNPEGTRLFSASVQQQVNDHQRQELVPGLIVEWDLATGRSLQTREHGAEALAAAADGNTWALREDQREIQLLDWKSQKVQGRLLEPQPGEPQPGGSTVVAPSRGEPFVFAPDGKTLATGGAANIVRLWNAVDGKLLRTFKGHIEQGTAILCFSEDGKQLATMEMTDRTDGGSLRLWDVDSGTETCVNPHHRGPIHGVAYSPDGRFIVSAGDDRRLLWWNARTGALDGESAGHDAPIKLLRFSADGHALLSMCQKQIVIWDTAKRTILSRAAGLGGSLAVSFNGDGKEFYTVDHEGGINTWDAATSKLKTNFSVHSKVEPESSSSRVVAAVFSPDSSQVALRRQHGHEIEVWNVAAQKRTRSFAFAPPPDPEVERPQRACSALAFSHDGRYVAASVSEATYWRRHYDYVPAPATILVFEIAGGAKALSATGLEGSIAALMFSPDGRTLLHSLADASSPERISYHYYFNGTARENQSPAAVLRDLTAGADLAHFTGTGPARICTTTGWELPVLPGILRSVANVAFSADGRGVATIDAQRTLLVWDVEKVLPRRTATAHRLSAAELDEAWALLSRSDSARAHAAIWQMTRDPQSTLAFLKKRLAPPASPEEPRLQHLIRVLNSDHFAARAQAMHELDRYAELAEPALRQALASENHLERKRRLEGLLARLGEDLRPDWLQQTRAIDTLEKLDDTEACALLAELSRGPAGARLTQDARAALERYQRRRTKSP